MPKLLLDRPISFPNVQSMDHKLGINGGHFVDGISEHVLEILDDFDNLSPYVAADLLANPNFSAPLLIDAHLFISVCWSRPFISFRIFGHIEPDDEERIFGLRMLPLPSDLFLIFALETVDVAFSGRLLVPE